SEQSGTGEVDRQFAQLNRNRWASFSGPRPMVAFAASMGPAQPPFRPVPAPVMAPLPPPPSASVPPQLDEAHFARFRAPQAPGVTVTNMGAAIASQGKQE